VLVKLEDPTLRAYHASLKLSRRATGMQPTGLVAADLAIAVAALGCHSREAQHADA